MDARPINLPNLLTLLSVAILVGVELVGAGWAAGWAISGLLQLGETIGHVLEIVFVALGLAGLFYFMRAALRVEPIRG
jgi:hypothetical protein